MDEQLARVHLREQSKRLFGNADRLEVAAAVARSDGIVDASSLSEQLGLPANRTRAQLLAFAHAGILEASPMLEQRCYYIRQSSAFWSLAEALADELSNGRFYAWQD
jgi:DNA-binding IclR family transcriptional regulator